MVVSTKAFEATEAQYFNSLINRNHLHEIEDGFYGELQGLGRQPILNAYSFDIGARGYYSALDRARTDANNATTTQGAMILGGAFATPIVLSGVAFFGGQAALFARSPSAYFYSTASRVSLPVVDDIAYSIVGLPGSMFAGYGATGAIMESNFASQFADDALDFARFYGDDVGSLSLYGRGDDIANTAADQFVGPLIGKSGFEASSEFADESFMRYQNYVNEGYDLAVAAESKGLLRGNQNTRIGDFVDRYSATEYRAWLSSEGITEGPGNLVQMNRWLRDPAGSGKYVRPDIRIPMSGNILDATVGWKWGGDRQIIRFDEFSSGDIITNVRPQQLEGSYSIWPRGSY